MRLAATDTELVQRVREGEIGAFEAVVARYQQLVFAVAFHCLGNVDDARDVAQDVFLRAFVRMDQVRDPERLGAWLRQVTVNECRAFAAKRKEWPSLPEQTPATDAIRFADDRLLVNRALSAIDDASRLTVILFYLHAYSLKEIGSFLNEPVTTIKSRLRNARAKLRRELEETLEKNLNEDALPADFTERVTRMIAAVQAGDQAAILDLLEADPRLATTPEDKNRSTPLHIAASAGNASVVELLLRHGADPNAKDIGDNATPLHYAAERGWIETVRLLVEAGTELNFVGDVHERGPLGWAVVFGETQREVAEYLMEQGARPDLFAAIALGLTDVVRELAQTQPAVLQSRLAECDGRKSPIEFAASKKQFEIAHLLVELGAKVGLADAAALGSVEHLRPLLEGKPDLSEAIDAAVNAGQTSTARVLLEHGADPNTAIHGTSLLFSATGNHDEPMCRLLIEHGADLEFRDRAWQSTPLGWRVFYGDPVGVDLALRLGASIDPQLVELSVSGARGELRSWSSGTPEQFRQVEQLLRAAQR